VATYDFICEGCGPFELDRRMALASDPATCPTCGGPGRRVFSPPSVAHTPARLRRALELEERSAHEPAIADRPRGLPLPSLHRHAQTPPRAVGG
jgi:putative FmdB family regulatory protein